MRRNQPDITPTVQTRPGGSHMTGGEEYIGALQNRNKTFLLEVLGSAPPLVEEIIPQTYEMRLTELGILRGTMNRIKQMSGIGTLGRDLFAITGNVADVVTNRYFFEIEQNFLPLQGFTRDILFAYESYLYQHQNLAVGIQYGAQVGAAIGGLYLGPAGVAAGGIIGGALGAGLGALAEVTGQNWFRGIWEQYTDPASPEQQRRQEAWEENFPRYAGNESSGGMPIIQYTGRPAEFYREQKGRQSYQRIVNMERRIFG